MQRRRYVIDSVFLVTLSNPSASQRIPFTQALLCIKNLQEFHVIEQIQYHTEADIEYMENYLKECHHRKQVFSQFHVTKSTKKVLEKFKSSSL